jgi:type I restriction enzyme S subunit
MVNMGELFAYPRINNLVMDLVTVNDGEAHFLLESEDLLFARQSLVLEGAGQCSIFVGNKKPTVFESHLIRCRLDKTISNPYFYFYFFRSPAGRTAIETIAEQGAGASGIRGSDLVKLAVPCPPKDQQDAVAAVLTALDDRIALLRETNATLETIAQALFKSWFVDFDPVLAKLEGRAPEGMDEATARLFPDSFEESELGLVPRGWSIGILSDLLVLQRGFDLPSQDRVPGDFPIIAASGPSGTHHESMAKGPGVVTGRSGLLGKVFLELEDYWPLNTTLWVKEFRAATPCFAYEVLRMLDFQSFNAGSAVPSLNRNHIHGLRYLIPQRSCVDAYEAIGMDLHTRVKLNNKQAETLATLRDTLLPRLISGQLRLNEIENEN